MSGFGTVRKYLIYIFIAGWMFFLGIITGRGTIPVHFDTVKFSDRLAAIAAQSLSRDKESNKESNKKIDLDFYQGLVNDSSVIDPEKKEPEIATPTQKSSDTDIQKTTEPGIATEPSKISDSDTQEPTESNKETAKYSYTLQVAAYQNYQDAVSEMAGLKEKGFSSYLEKAQQNGKLWYRIRVGTFANLDHAKLAKNWLNKAGITSIIIKREQDEDTH
jgi:cell division protein FtsN